MNTSCIPNNNRADLLAAIERRRPSRLPYTYYEPAAETDKRLREYLGLAPEVTTAAYFGCNFFQHQRERQVVQPGAPLLLRHANAIRSQRGQALVGILGKVVLFVPLGGIRPQLGLCKIANRIAHHLLVLTKYQFGLQPL